MMSGECPQNVAFGLEELQAVEVGGALITIYSVKDLEHVNALSSSEPLTFDATGLTIVYGDNGSGKSG